MGLFDSFSAENTAGFVDAVKASQTDEYTSPSSLTLDGSSFYKVYIYADTQHGEGISLVADGPQEFSFDTSVDYDTPYKNTAEEFIQSAADKINMGSLASAATKVATATGTKLFTQALTAKVWSGGGITRLSVPLVFQVEDDPEKDILMPLMKLMYLSMPREDKVNGFLSGPGPRFDISGALGGSVSGVLGAVKDGIGSWLSKSSGTMTSTEDSVLAASVKSFNEGANKLASAASNAIKNTVKYPISVQIGSSFRLESVVITSVSQVHRMAPIGYGPGESSGINSQVRVNVDFESFYTLTQRDIKKMMLPMNSKYGEETDRMYQALIGENNGL